MGAVYQFAVEEHRTFIDHAEVAELAARAEAVASSLHSFGRLDDRGGDYRSEVLRQIRDFASRATAVLS